MSYLICKLGLKCGPAQKIAQVAIHAYEYSLSIAIPFKFLATGPIRKPYTASAHMVPYT